PRFEADVGPEEWGRVLRIVEFARLTLTRPDDAALTEMAEAYSVSYTPRLLQIIQAALLEGERLALRESLVDFTDMLWLVERWELQPARYDWLFIDELQDLNAAQRALALKLSGGRTTGVGDL